MLVIGAWVDPSIKQSYSHDEREDVNGAKQTKSLCRYKEKRFIIWCGWPCFSEGSPNEGVLRFERKGNFSPHFISPFEILEWICPVAYHLTLPPSLSMVYNVIHVFMLWSYLANPTHRGDFTLTLSKNLSYEEKLKEILARDLKTPRNWEIALIKVLWQNHFSRMQNGREKIKWEVVPIIVSWLDFWGPKHFKVSMM